MSTYREISYMCMDLLKAIADDSYYTVDHIIYLADKYRAFLLKKTYSDIKKEIPESNYQSISLTLEDIMGIPGDSCSNRYLRSTSTIPETIEVAKPRISSTDPLLNNITYVSPVRFNMTGYNKWLKNIIYGTIGSDNKLYLRSANPQAYYLTNAIVTGIFEDASEVSALEEPDICDVLDRKFPLEEALIPTLIELIVKEVSGSLYKPKDADNNANDELSQVATKTNQ